MPDVDSNGVDILDRFLAYKSRFMQFSVTEDVFHQVVEHIKELRAERDEVRQSYCSLMEAYRGGDGKATAEKMGWQYLFKEDGND
jgi:hypothetical protein